MNGSDLLMLGGLCICLIGLLIIAIGLMMVLFE